MRLVPRQTCVDDKTRAGEQKADLDDVVAIHGTMSCALPIELVSNLCVVSRPLLLAEVLSWSSSLAAPYEAVAPFP